MEKKTEPSTAAVGRMRPGKGKSERLKAGQTVNGGRCE